MIRDELDWTSISTSRQTPSCLLEFLSFQEQAARLQQMQDESEQRIKEHKEQRGMCPRLLRPGCVQGSYCSYLFIVIVYAECMLNVVLICFDSPDSMWYFRIRAKGRGTVAAPSVFPTDGTSLIFWVQISLKGTSECVLCCARYVPQEQMAQIKDTMTADRDAAMAAMEFKMEAQFQEHQKKLQEVQQVRAPITLVPPSRLKFREVFLRNEMYVR